MRKWGEGEESQGETGMYTIRYAKKVCELGIRKLLVLSHLAIVEDCEANIRLYDIVRENSL